MNTQELEKAAEEITDRYNGVGRGAYSEMLKNGTAIFPGAGRKPDQKEPEALMGLNYDLC